MRISGTYHSYQGKEPKGAFRLDIYNQKYASTSAKIK
jgi:hypothetical protein